MNVLEFVVRQRWLFAIFLLPISFFYDIFWFLRSKFVLWMGSAPTKHKERVLKVQKQVNFFPATKIKSTFYVIASFVMVFASCSNNCKS